MCGFGSCSNVLLCVEFIYLYFLWNISNLNKQGMLSKANKEIVIKYHALIILFVSPLKIWDTM